MNNGTETGAASVGRLDIVMPAENYEAGQLIVLPVVIRNPFDSVIHILELQAPRSSLLREPKERESKADQQDGKKEQRTWAARLSDIFLPISSSFFTLSGVRVEFLQQRKVLNIEAEKDSNIAVYRALRDFDVLNVTAGEDATLVIGSPEQAIGAATSLIETLQPHSETVAYFTIRTSGWLFFKPKRLNIAFRIKYRVLETERSQVVSTAIDVHPPLRSMVLGSMIGSILGYLASSLTAADESLITSEWELVAVRAGAAVVMSVIATIALSRKTGAQGFITVEDFFGGFVIGTLIAYGGVQYFEQAIAISSDQAQ